MQLVIFTVTMMYFSSIVCNEPTIGPFPKAVLKECTTKTNRWHWWRRTRSPNTEVLSEETAARRALLRKQRVKRTKFAMLLAYVGQRYFGFQRNPGVKTIEEDLLLALFKIGYINEEILNNPRLIRLERASRTDKGVSALGQVVSLKLPVNASLDDINAHLSPEIQAVALVKVTQGFSSRTYANARSYSYTMPTYAFAHHTTDSSSSFLMSEKLRERIDAILRLFVGFHSFHNFTAGKTPLESSAFRTIIDFICGESFILDDTEFVTLRIKGKSFMLHQIRKMIGLVIAIMRGLATPETLKKSLEHTVLNLPLAPSIGLMLEKVWLFPVTTTSNNL
ncbi:tRNA pseudouridine synthase A-like isoform X2 [Homalodisca vitripennis]|uniref:tRNA pseudouridine synthase A-like isoform X2 n=1 Tax=Homalodisca vitripennis TaxID=197043 RepID=UPI001EEC9F2E|nr:tRNA pseudouridine synthase A-like isoform X2 [Homalodisca vitripennis]